MNKAQNKPKAETSKTRQEGKTTKQQEPLPNHKERFNQLLDDAVLGVKKK